ncbi:NAD(P)-binding protein [Aspergillus venezuelensis]
MPSYVVTGASRGLGFEFVRQLAADSNNTVIGVVRNKAAADAKAKEQGLALVHFVEAQYTDLDSLKTAADIVKGLTGESLNYLINNAASVSEVSELRTFEDFQDDFPTLESDILDSFTINVLGVMKTIEAFLPLLLSGQGEKKIITITSGMSDLDLINASEIAVAGPYAMSKGALNVMVAKYNALYKARGILSLGVCPGYVATERQTQELKNDEDKARLAALGAKFASLAPDFKGPTTPDQSVSAVLGLAHKASIKDGFGGAFVSRFGNKTWF